MSRSLREPKVTKSDDGSLMRVVLRHLRLKWISIYFLQSLVVETHESDATGLTIILQIDLLSL